MSASKQITFTIFNQGNIQDKATFELSLSLEECLTVIDIIDESEPMNLEYFQKGSYQASLPTERFPKVIKRVSNYLEQLEKARKAEEKARKAEEKWEEEKQGWEEEKQELIAKIQEKEKKQHEIQKKIGVLISLSFLVYLLFLGIPF